MGLFDNLFKKSGEKSSREKPAMEKQHTVKEPEARQDAENAARMAEIKSAIQALRQNSQDMKPLIAMMSAFVKSTFWVPMSANLSGADTEQFLNARVGDTVSLKEQMRLRPDFLKTADGKLFFPAFTAQEETEPAYRKRFSWVCLPGLEIAKIAHASEKLEGVVINGFSQAQVLGKTLLEFMIEHGSAGVVQHVLEKGAQVRLSAVGDEGRLLKLTALELLKGVPQVRRAFMARMEHGGETSYLFAIDADLPDCKALYQKLNAALQPLHPAFPLDFGPAQNFKAQLLAGHCAMFYHKDGLGRERTRVPMDDRRYFFVTERVDDEGFLTGYSFDFESANDSHYDISADEAVRLSERLPWNQPDAPRNLIIQVHDALESALAQPGTLESALRELLKAHGVMFQLFYY